ALVLDRDTVRDVRIAWGGIAHKPWRATRAEAALRGGPLPEDRVRDATEDAVRVGPLTEERVREAAEPELADARTTEQNAWKVPMVRNATVKVLTALAEEAPRSFTPRNCSLRSHFRGRADDRAADPPDRAALHRHR